MNYIKRINETPDITLTEFRQATPDSYLRDRSMSGVLGSEQTQPDRVVIHVADGTYPGTLTWFATPGRVSPVSAHFTVAMDGRLAQSVYERAAAYHSGKWSMNIRSFGIEHEGEPSKGPWYPSEAMYETSARLTAYLCYRYGIPVDREHIIGHNEVNPDRAARRNCPGPTWNWSKYMILVKQEYRSLAGIVAQPAHEKDDANKTLMIVNDGGDLLVGQGTLIAGTNKLYIKNLNRDTVKLGAPRLSSLGEYREVRVFDPPTNIQIGTGIYWPKGGKVYIVELAPRE